MADLSHSVRSSLAAPERTFGLERDALVWEDARGTGRVAYADIVNLRLYGYRNLSGPLLWRCVLKDRSGRKIVLVSAHYVRLGTFENRIDTYAPLMRELLRRIAAANPRACFIAGPPWPLWFFWLLILIASVPLLAFAAIVAVQGELPLVSILYFAIVIAFLPRAWHTVRHDRPRVFDPSNPPAGLLRG